MDRPVFRRPAIGVEQAEQRLDIMTGELVRAAREAFARVRSRLESRTLPTRGHHPAARIIRLKERLIRLSRNSGWVYFAC